MIRHQMKEIVEQQKVEEEWKCSPLLPGVQGSITNYCFIGGVNGVMNSQDNPNTLKGVFCYQTSSILTCYPLQW